VPPVPGLDNASLLLRPVVIGVLPVAAGTDARTAAEAAQALVAAGADVVEVVLSGPVAGATPAGLSQAELVASLTEAGIPAAVTVAGVADVHLAAGSGAVLLRCVAPDRAVPMTPGVEQTDPVLAARAALLHALTDSGLPVIRTAEEALVAQVRADGLPRLPTAAIAFLPPRAASSGPFLELPIAVITAPRRDVQPLRDAEPGTVVPVVAAIDAEHAADHSVVAAQVTAALVVGVRVFRTPDPRTVRRVAHVITAVEVAG
jgi:hypothetical protein